MIVSDKTVVGPWVAKKVFCEWTPVGREAIGLERRGELVAGVMYDNWNGRSIMAHIAVQGLMTPAYLAAIFHYPFVVAGVEKVICPIAESNVESIKLCTKMGFTREATLRDAHPDGDLFLYSLRRQDCRFLGARYGDRINIAEYA